MVKTRTTSRRRSSLQSVTLCISTALVLILLGIIVCSTLMARNLSTLVRENLVVTLLMEQDMSDGEAQIVKQRLTQRPYIKQLHYISKANALREATQTLGADPSEFTEGVNPFTASIEVTLRGDYANNDSLEWISGELKKMPGVSDVTYQKNLIDKANRTLAKVGVVLLVLAVLLTFVSFTLISNTVRLDIYARRFAIHTMKLVGASWSFIRWPFVRRAMGIGLLAAVLALAVLTAGGYALWTYEPDIVAVVTWVELAATVVAVLAFGLIITAICATISVNKYLKMKASELYNI